MPRTPADIEAEIVGIVSESRACDCPSVSIEDEVRLYCRHENDRVSALFQELRELKDIR